MTKSTVRPMPGEKVLFVISSAKTTFLGRFSGKVYHTIPSTFDVTTDRFYFQFGKPVDAVLAVENSRLACNSFFYSMTDYRKCRGLGKYVITKAAIGKDSSGEYLQVSVKQWPWIMPNWNVRLYTKRNKELLKIISKELDNSIQ